MLSGGEKEAGRGCLALGGRQDGENVWTVRERVILVLWVIPLPFLKSILESTKYGSVCLLIVRSKVPRGLNYLKRERRRVALCNLTSTCSHCNQACDRQLDRKPLGMTFPGASEMESMALCMDMVNLSHWR